MLKLPALILMFACLGLAGYCLYEGRYFCALVNWCTASVNATIYLFGNRILGEIE